MGAMWAIGHLCCWQWRWTGLAMGSFFGFVLRAIVCHCNPFYSVSFLPSVNPSSFSPPFFSCNGTRLQLLSISRGPTISWKLVAPFCQVVTNEHIFGVWALTSPPLREFRPVVTAQTQPEVYLGRLIPITKISSNLLGGM